MHMARVNVYLPDELAREARSAGLNISSIAQEALSRRLMLGETERWIDRLEQLQPSGVSHERVIEAVDAARAELGGEPSS